MKNKTFNTGYRTLSAFPRPLPYFNTGSSVYEKNLAKALRKEFISKVSRRLTGHHLRGFEHSFIINYVATHKKNFPYFVRTDIEKFYPSIDHKALLTNVQLAYRDLISLPYVPSSFKKKYVSSIKEWCENQPLTRGIPIASPLSAILAPIMLLPLWLKIKKIFNVPILVFMDDVLIFAKSQEQLTDIYCLMENELQENYKLSMNPAKTHTGRFANSTTNFCGWEFKGGYARIKEIKMRLFLQRLLKVHNRYFHKPL